MSAKLRRVQRALYSSFHAGDAKQERRKPRIAENFRIHYKKSLDNIGLRHYNNKTLYITYCYFLR